MRVLGRLLGEFHWTPPEWGRRLGLRRLGLGASAVVAFAALVYVGYEYYASLPKPTQVVARVVAPGITPVVDGELRPEPLTIDFSVVADPRLGLLTVDSVARIDLIGTALGDGITLEPPMRGEWRWASETQLQFLPAEDWPAGQEYAVRYTPALFAPNLELAADEARFTTPEFSVALDELVFYQDPVDRALRKVVATLSFSHPVDPRSLDAHVTYAMRESGQTIEDTPRPVDREIQYDELRRRAFIHSSPLEIPAQESYLALVVSADVAPERGPSRFESELRRNVTIPDIASYFRVDGVQALIVRNANDEPEQTVVLELTDWVRTASLEERLRVYLLPTDAVVNGQPRQNFRWQSPREVTAPVLARSERLEIALNPAEGDSAKVHSFRLDVPEDRDLYVLVEQGLRSQGDFVMSRPYDTIVRAPSYPKEAVIAQDGAIVSLSGTHRLTFVSRGVGTLKVDVGRLIASEVNHLASQTAGDVKSPYFTNYAFNEDNLTVRQSRYLDLAAAHPKTAVYSNLDLSEFLPDGGYYFVRVQGWDRTSNRAIGRPDQRFVLITDLGLLVKSNADETQDVFLHSIRTGEPVVGASVQLLGKNGVPIVVRTTSAEGHAEIPATSTFEREKTPTVFVVRFGRDEIFMPYSRSERMLQYSRFDVGGEQVRQRTDLDRLRALVFTDRGIYRPGDTANLAVIVKDDGWRPLSNLPLALEVRAPSGQTVMDERFALPDDGFSEHDFATDAASPTGNYNATLYLLAANRERRAIGSVAFQVEEFLPDRMRIRAAITGQKPVGWLKPGSLFCDVTLENLFGTPAESRRVVGQLELVPTGVRFSRYPGYVFDDPLREAGNAVQAVQQPLADATTDAQGSVRLPLDLGRYARGIYRLTVSAEGFEEGGGRSVKAQASTILSPLDFLIGYNTDGELGYVDRNSRRTVQFLAIDADAEALALDGLSLSIVEERYVSTLVRQPNGTYAYQSILQESLVSNRDYSIAADGSELVLPTDRPGRFAVKIAAADGLVYSKVRYTVAGAGNIEGNLERNAELTLTLNSQSYDAGAEIALEITAPYTGTGLITIERERVHAYKWFRTTTTTSVQTISVPSNLEGNAYVNVAFIRDIDSPEIFVSPLSYAVAPFAIDRAARTIEIAVDAPDLVRPGETLTVGYSASRPSRAILYAVDEGILQVASYEMPDPLGFFLRKMALQVDTYQMVDLILPDFEAYQRLAAPGGGEAAGLLGQNLNPFQRKTEAPVVFWSGIVESGPERRTVDFTVPDYFNGRLRIMAVAVADTAVGRRQDETVVRGPFVITPSVLTAAAPGDEFDVTVGVSNNLEGSGTNAAVTLSVAPSAELEIVGPATTELRIDEGREGRTTFRVRAKDGLGAATLAFEASSGVTAARLAASLSVRPPVPRIVTMVSGSDNGDPLELTFERTLYDEFAARSAGASVSPLILADGLLEYLDAFPHACAEQIVSKVFPQIGFLGSGDGNVDEARIRALFDRTIGALQSRQTPNGGFRFWASSPEAADFPSVYILHFLTDAVDLGLPTPRDMLGAGLGYLQRFAAQEVRSLPEARLRAYAIYVLTRNGSVTTNYLTNLHEWLDREAPDTWEADLTAVYMAASYQMLRQAGLAAQLIGAYELGSGDEMTSDFDTRLGRDAQYVYVLARHFPGRLGELEAADIKSLVAPVMQNRFNTLSSAYTVLALGAYTRAVFADAGAIRLDISAATPGAAEILAEAAVFARARMENDVDRVRIGGAGGTEIYYVLTEAGFDQAPPATGSANGLEIFRDYLDANGDPVSAARVGDDLTVVFRIRSTGRPRTNVAVVDLLPGGFEVDRDSIRNQLGGWLADYVDIREDRIVVYGSFDDRVTEIRYRVKATSPGDFIVPSAAAGSMYDRSVQASTAASRFRVSAAL
jgi:uncharacterized protein YfaS (alpha-2-macroglobulin family)